MLYGEKSTSVLKGAPASWINVSCIVKMGERFLKQVARESYTQLGVSPINGVGVFASRRIPAGTNPFKTRGRRAERLTKVTPAQLRRAPKHVQRGVRAFFLPEASDSNYYVSSWGLNNLNPSFYMNSCATPNVTVTDGRDGPYAAFRTLRPIAVGEELTFDYPLT